MHKRLLIIPAFIVLVGMTLLATDNVDAFGLGFGPGGEDDEIISRFAEKFGRSEDEVRSVFDEVHQEHMNQMENQFEERLNEMVADGTITAEQKQLMLDKHAELHQMHQDTWEEAREMSPEDRRATLQAQHDEIETWAAENDIDIDGLHMMLGPRSGKGVHGMGPGMDADEFEVED